MRPKHERRDFAAAMRAAGLEKCKCGDWSSDVVGGLCGWCRELVTPPDPALFDEGTLEHLMATNLKERA
jgi:hypothetical protein